MLGDHTPIPTLGVKDLARAREFYEGTLGFSPESDMDEGVTYRSGSGRFFVYISAFAGTNKATAMTFEMPAEDFDAEVAALRKADVSFQTFEAEGMEWDDGVASMRDGSMRTVWFEDPDGNILNIGTGLG